MATEEDNKLFFVGMKAFIGKDDTLLILRESDSFADGGKWELPGGRIAHGEEAMSLQDVLLREVKEECGNLKIEVGNVIHAFRRQFANGDWVFLNGFDCKYLSGEIELSDEHIEYDWISRSDMHKYVFVNGYKDAIETYFSKTK